MLPAKLKKVIARDMANVGPRAVIAAMANVLVRADLKAMPEQTAANNRCGSVLTEILKHWKE